MAFIILADAYSHFLPGNSALDLASRAALERKIPTLRRQIGVLQRSQGNARS